MSEVNGKIHFIGQTEVVGSAGTFKKRTIVIATDEQYSQKIPIDFVQDKTDILDKYQIGQEVKVSINIRGNEYNGKYYCSLNGWKIEKTDIANGQNIANDTAPFTTAEKLQTPPDDLPF
jgi:hypothetical protein